jgi:hypothetical protein
MFVSEKLPYGVQFYGDSKIHEAFSQRMNTSEAVDYLLRTDLYNDEFVQSNLSLTFDELVKREKSCDIVISDFIREHFRDQYLFYTPNHPTELISLEMANRIIMRLGISGNMDTEGLVKNDNFQMLIYPSIKHHLNLCFIKESFFFNKRLFPLALDYPEYFGAYKALCFPELNGLDHGASIRNADEKCTREKVILAYILFHRRPPESEEAIQFWVKYMEHHSFYALNEMFLASDEFQAKLR